MAKGEKLIIINQTVVKEPTNEEIEGLTILVDGAIGQMFEILRQRKGYSSNNEVLRDIIFKGAEALMRETSPPGQGGESPL